MNRQILTDLLKKKEFKAVRSILEVMNTVDIAALLAELEDKEMILAFRLIEKAKAAEVFAEMSSSMQTYLVEMFTEKELKDLIDELYMDDTVDLLEELPANLVTRILEQVDKERRAQINTILNYPEDSAGSIMTTEYVDLRRTTTVKEAMDHIKKTGIHKETIYTCYVLENRRLVGIVSAKDLMTMDDDMTMEELMETEIISVTTHTDQEEAVHLLSKYDLLALPVLDQQGYMVGIVTVDDAMDVLVDETTEDMEIMNALSPSEQPYFETGVIKHARNRIGWLLVLMLSATLTQTIIAHYQEAFTAVPLLVSFIPMLTDTGGNCGSQSSTLIIRGIALDEIHFKDIFKVIFKEFRVAILVGAALAVVNGIYMVIRYHDPMLALLVSISLVATILIAKLIGCVLPLVAKKLRLDPAIMAAPLITTIVDVCSIMVYFQVATHLLHLV
ncbi:magnesium transporter [Drancourtella massiliensis]|uniref:Magnesium transporter MgtE n=1 Tax=Drancourtella massiliensis TaxID=1632013 RepID=A0ABS2EHM8_9FIRM|nr:magnesium transporter [Drancourtella massiliensis]MBM6744422.1 magnesium transporter [Drancourtella massiliensis]HIV95003.1 magnesium transporter [Candidatus Sellimonas avistercoris]